MAKVTALLRQAVPSVRRAAALSPSVPPINSEARRTSCLASAILRNLERDNTGETMGGSRGGHAGIRTKTAL